MLTVDGFPVAVSVAGPEKGPVVTMLGAAIRGRLNALDDLSSVSFDVADLNAHLNASYFGSRHFLLRLNTDR